MTTTSVAKIEKATTPKRRGLGSSDSNVNEESLTSKKLKTTKKTTNRNTIAAAATRLTMHRATFAAAHACIRIVRCNGLGNNMGHSGAIKNNRTIVADLLNVGLDHAILKLTPKMCTNRTQGNGTAISDEDAISGVLFALQSYNQTLPAVGHTVVCDKRRFSLPSELAPAAIALLHSLTVVDFTQGQAGGGFKLNGPFDEGRLLALIQSAIADQTLPLPMLPSVRTNNYHQFLFIILTHLSFFSVHLHHLFFLRLQMQYVKGVRGRKRQQKSLENERSK
jgi:hypothetical protein